VLDRHRRLANSKNKQIAVKSYKQAQCIRATIRASSST
jgi:hypothetical protein